MDKQNFLNLGIVIDNEWLDKYICLINNNINTPKQRYKTQRHHIIPKYYYKSNNMLINNNKSNLVNLLYRDHVLAHYYLARCSSEPEFVCKNYYALSFASNSWEICTDEQIEIDNFIASLDGIQELYSISKRELGKISQNYERSDEYRQHLSQSLKGRESPAKGRKRYTNGIINKMDFAPPSEEFYLGRSYKCSEDTKIKMSNASLKKWQDINFRNQMKIKRTHSNLGKKLWNNGIIQVMSDVKPGDNFVLGSLMTEDQHKKRSQAIYDMWKNKKQI